METYIAALDQGTTTSRAILFNSRGEIVSKAQYPFRQIFPQPGWVEHDPMEIWATTVRALSEAVDAAHIDPKAIAGVGITNQRETAILWDRRTGQPVYNAIVWQAPPDTLPPSSSAFRRRISPFRLYRLLHRQDYSLFPALCHPLLQIGRASCRERV